MAGVNRVTVSLPASLLAAVDEKLVRAGETRSAALCRLLEQALRDLEEQVEIERYVRGYRERPQTEEELGWADEVARQVLAEEPWE